jgi:hypothetical protein
MSVFSVDLRSLAALRVVLGLLVIADVVARWSTIDVLYTDDGVLPRSLLTGYLSTWEWSLYKLDGGSGLTTLLFGVTIAAALALILGVQTRVTSVVVWVLLVSLQVCNPLVSSGADILLRVVMFWAMLLPLGQVWSFDAWRSREAADPASMKYVSFASAGMILQIACMYVFTAWLKSGDTWRTEGTALYYATGKQDISRGFGEFLHGYPDLLRILTHASLGFEFLIPLLFISPWMHERLRLVAVAACMVFHAGIFLIMDVGLFPFVSAFCMVGLLPSMFWNRVVPVVRRRLGRDAETAEVTAETASGPVRGTILLNAFAAFCIVFIVVWNLTTVTSLSLSKEVRATGYTLALDQTWSMFAPNPSRSTEWQVVGGITEDFTSINLLPAVVADDYSEAIPYTTEQPPDIVSNYYQTKYWRKYFEHMTQTSREEEQQAFATYVCESWNAKHEGGQRLNQISLIEVRVRTLPDEQRGEPTTRIINAFGCG